MKFYKTKQAALMEKEPGEIVILHPRFGCSSSFGAFPPWAVISKEEVDFNPSHVAWRCPQCGRDTGAPAHSMRQDGSLID